MHPFLKAMCLAIVFSAPASAGFTLIIEDRDLEANSPDQAVNVFLKSTFEAQIHSVMISSFIGAAEDVVKFGDLAPSDFYDNEGNFQGAASPSGAIQVVNNAYFWDLRQSWYSGLAGWGNNVAQVEARFESTRTDPTDYLTVLPADRIKIATLHFDTRGVSNPTLKLSLYDPTNALNYPGSPSGYLGVTSVKTSDGTIYSIANPQQLTLMYGDNAISDTFVTFDITSTPEPSVIGMLGLSLAGGAGWLRARARRRKAAQ